MIKNKKTGQIYIGQSKNIERRFQDHCSTSPVDIAIACDGVENFDFNIIEETSKEKLIQQERFWVQYYDVENDDKHYNIGGGGEKYSLWNVSCCAYSKGDMHKRGRESNPCKCFRLQYQARFVPIGLFHDFVSVEIINQLIKEAIKE